MFRVSCIQLRSNDNLQYNLIRTKRLIRKAIKQKTDFIITPEVSSLFSLNKKKLLKICTSMDRDVYLNEIKKIAKKYKKWILIGSLIIKVSKNKLVNRSVLLDKTGRIRTYYDKIHMYDAKLSKFEKYRESKTFKPGKKIKIVNLPWGKLGLSICYDLRFPNMYRKMSKKGAIFLSIPSAFTDTTGKRHWHTLLKARAIENFSYVFAPGQAGKHCNGRKTYGHSMIVSPDGKILKELKKSEGVVTVSIDPKLPKNRLGLAKWLFDKKNPLTSRVFVNRIWQMHFGKGLSSSTDDLGSQGTLPNYPELLDWLSIQFVKSNWNIKKLHKLILLSATYQQNSINDIHIMTNDPENNLLARGPSFRMSAEMIRDNALSISGLLVNKLGGKSVYPYQPEGIWDLSDKVWKYKYEHDKGDGLYRRSLYTFWKRSAPPPSMLIFDTPNRDACSVKRTLTSTPLQALVLLNDPQYTEVARVLAESVLIQNNNNIESALEIAFRKVIGRRPLISELESIASFYEDELNIFKLQPKKTMTYLNVGEKILSKKSMPYKTAAMAKVISGLLNTSEAIMIR